MKRSMILVASAGLLFTAQSLPLAAQSDDADYRRQQWFKEYVESVETGVTRRAPMTVTETAPHHISDDAEYRRHEAFKNRTSQAGGRLSTASGESRWGPLHISDDAEYRRQQ